VLETRPPELTRGNFVGQSLKVEPYEKKVEAVVDGRSKKLRGVCTLVGDVLSRAGFSPLLYTAAVVRLRTAFGVGGGTAALPRVYGNERFGKRVATASALAFVYPCEAVNLDVFPRLCAVRSALAGYLLGALCGAQPAQRARSTRTLRFSVHTGCERSYHGLECSASTRERFQGGDSVSSGLSDRQRTRASQEAGSGLGATPAATRCLSSDQRNLYR